MLVRYETDDANVAWLTLDDPDTRNALGDRPLTNADFIDPSRPFAFAPADPSLTLDGHGALFDQAGQSRNVSRKAGQP